MSKKNIDNPTPDQLVQGFREAMVVATGWAEWEVQRADGGVEKYRSKNSEIAVGLNYLAQLATGQVTSYFNYISVGTVTAASSLGSTNWGEVARKVQSQLTNSKSLVIVANTWGGAADSLTGIALYSSALVNHVNSGQGSALAIVNSVGNVTLTASDILLTRHLFRIGSHNL